MAQQSRTLSRSCPACTRVYEVNFLVHCDCGAKLPPHPCPNCADLYEELDRLEEALKAIAVRPNTLHIAGIACECCSCLARETLKR